MGTACCLILAYLQVRIVRERGTGKVLAMKKLRKAEMLRRGQVSVLQAVAKCVTYA